MRFAEIPMKLAGLLQHPDPIIINHIIRYGGADPITLALRQTFSASVHEPTCTLSSVDPTDQKKTACYDIDVEVEDLLKSQMNNFLSSTTNQQEIAALEMKVIARWRLRVWNSTVARLEKASPVRAACVVLIADPRDNRVHQPAEDGEGLHAELQRQPAGVHPGLAQVTEQRPEGEDRCCVCHFLLLLF